MLIPLLTIEGIRVITPAQRRVIQSGEAATLAGHTHQRRGSSKASHTQVCLCSLTWQVIRNIKPQGSFGGTQPWSYLYISTLFWFNIDAIQSNIYIHHTQTDWAVSSYTNTSEGIWMLTAEGQLWSVASINDISANATPKTRKKKRKKILVARLEDIGDPNKCCGNSGSVQALHTSVHQDSFSSVSLSFRLNTNTNTLHPVRPRLLITGAVRERTIVWGKSFPIKRLNLLVITFHRVTKQQDSDGFRKYRVLWRDWFKLNGAWWWLLPWIHGNGKLWKVCDWLNIYM